MGDDVEIKLISDNVEILKGETTDMMYAITNTTGNKIIDIEMDFAPMRKTATGWMPIESAKCEPIAVPTTLGPMETKKFAVQVAVDNKYNEVMYDPILKVHKEVAFAVHTTAKYKKVAEVE